MDRLKKTLDRIFIDGLSAMAQGLFATLIIGTIIQQIGTLLGGTVGDMIFVIGKVAASLTGAGIGAAVAYRFKESPLVVVSAGTAGMVGAFAGKLLAGGLFFYYGTSVLGALCNTVAMKYYELTPQRMEQVREKMEQLRHEGQKEK